VPAAPTRILERRTTGRELPWARFEIADPFETYEAPVLSGPGRYLWVVIELRGNTRFTPRFRSLRVEYPSHDLLRRLPKLYSREPEPESFLRRYLAMFDGVLTEWDGKATARHALLNPSGALPEVLPWLGSFVGMTLDERWPVATRRTAIREAIWLFRFRGTVPGLKRFLEIYLNTQVIIVERFRFRGLGAVGDAGGPVSRAILGAGFRVGGAVGDSTFNPLSGATEDAFDTHAHRFSVVIPASLSDEQMSVVQQILDRHRPAHTLVDVCTVGAGMRVGRGLLEMTSIIGRTGGFRRLQIGGSTLGRDAIIGRPRPGTVPEASILGRDSRVG
jgi:phage tail-like protein